MPTYRFGAKTKTGKWLNYSNFRSDEAKKMHEYISENLPDEFIIHSEDGYPKSFMLSSEVNKLVKGEDAELVSHANESSKPEPKMGVAAQANPPKQEFFNGARFGMLFQKSIDLTMQELEFRNRGVVDFKITSVPERISYWFRTLSVVCQDLEDEFKRGWKL